MNKGPIKRVGGIWNIEFWIVLIGKEAEIAKSIAVDKEIVCLEALREWQMVCNTGLQVGEILQNNPDLFAKVGVEKLKVLMVVGKSHKDLI